MGRQPAAALVDCHAGGRQMLAHMLRQALQGVRAVARRHIQVQDLD